MVPDKIYINGFSAFATEPIKDGTEYIRKEALLEWAKGEIMPGNSAEGKGWNWALQTLLEKLESL